MHLKTFALFGMFIVIKQHYRWTKHIRMKEKEYNNGEITISWKPELCQHARVCVKLLPEVYHPNEKPWIKLENASSKELEHQVSKCPSGALSIKI